MFFEQPVNKKEKLIEQIVSLTRQSGVTLKDIAGILGAEEFLSYDKRRKLYHFDARQYIEKRIKEEAVVLVPEHVENLKQVILTPGEGEIMAGSGEGFGENRIFPRTRFLIELLSQLNLPFEVLDGVVTPDMMRRESYKIFIISKIGKAVFVNNEEGNATRILHSFETRNEILKLSELTKEELDALPQIEKINYTGDEDSWKERIRVSLNLELFSKEISTSAVEEERSEERKKAPEGWLSNSILARNLHIDHQRVRELAASYKGAHPEWFHHYLFRSQYVEGFHPELVAIIKNEIEDQKRRNIAPDKWLTASKLSSELSKHSYAIIKFAERHRALHPDWFDTFIAGGQMIEHYSPELIEIIKEKFGGHTRVSITGYEHAPEGWSTASKLMKVLPKGYKWIVDFVEQYRLEHPDWFHPYITGKRVSENYHPDLVKILHEKANE